MSHPQYDDEFKKASLLFIKEANPRPEMLLIHCVFSLKFLPYEEYRRLYKSLWTSLLI